jgi:hypothetical protein
MRAHPVVFCLFAAACGSSTAPSAPATRVATARASVPAAVAAWTTPAESQGSPPPDPAEWLRSRMPPGGAVVGSDPVVVQHTVRANESAASIAKAYVAITDVYMAEDLVGAFADANPQMRCKLCIGGVRVATGMVLTVPHVLAEAPPPPTRLPASDAPSKGIFFIGAAAGKPWIPALERLKARGLNAVVLDGKDYMGPVTYPSKVGQATETGATKGAPISDLARTIRFAHDHGVRVIMRNSCFHDPWAAEKAPRMSVRGTWGGAYPIGWLDPANPEVAEYVQGLVAEELDAGADEIQLDYIRYPVQPGLGNADFKVHMKGRTRIEVIRDFVHGVHELTKARGVPLSIDVFGVAATGTREDIEGLGQDLGVLGHEVEFIMPMVYPSHYGTGFYGWEIPGDHPEIVGIGTKAAIDILEKANASAKIRPWLQAFPWKSPTYSSKYIAEEAKSADAAGASGWIAWNPGSEYSVFWQALPVQK